ncbi:16S rRNA (guanine(527)-N(7))-methyltransferase RsmG [Methylophilus sp. VKM B-3414]|uniref:16S rRNA (guanine(527)-N(7))-methyltransferase RsmG n=1 Tax=Methylophilus sp. VKM B-3414 TaxID=3076121 RepID=UPI0028C51DC5|nr:16S rRNA (guanine(527)-N(7))-methyltransferase RsmG [Methylophilus sp. VKM B-3414]MDT7848605.1 16S rRNA (guanine(527)-N(7))-methyltransferase RsmG [Methylophilus sp. VKM B-3414]
MELASKLAAGVELLGLQAMVTPEMQEKCLAYMALMQKWNKVYNLTAVRDSEEMLVLHVLDSLSVLPFVEAGNVLDVGSGGGLPGLIIAITRPEVEVTTIDTVQKKAIFMRQVKAELGLSNAQVVHGRVEAYAPPTRFSQVISRAFSDIALFKQLTAHLIAPRGRWLAMKGVVPSDELAQAKVIPKEVIRLHVPYLQAERHLIVFENT